MLFFYRSCSEAVVMTNWLQDKYPLVKDTKIMLGVVWPDRHVAFPDFFDPTNATQNWWIQEFATYQQQVPYDGIWIDMNEPANFGTNEANPWYFGSEDHPDDEPLMCPMNSTDGQWDMPPYKTHAVYNYGQGAYLASKTCACWAYKQMVSNDSTISRISTAGVRRERRNRRNMQQPEREGLLFLGLLSSHPAGLPATGWVTIPQNGETFKRQSLERRSLTCLAYRKYTFPLQWLVAFYDEVT
ncbi:hypothetical protein COOONC_03154, partial [Cooperia oncophora]